MSSRYSVLPLIALPLFPALSFAETPIKSDTVIVTASRMHEVQKLPANITVITAEDIKNSASRTLSELLAQEVGVNTRSIFDQGTSATVGLRGFGSTATQNTLILLDGRRLNGIDLSEVNFAAIPFENIERIEIIRGSGSVLYGDGATGGTINIVTKAPRNTKNYTKLTLTGGSFGERKGNVAGAYSQDNFGLTANISSTERDGYRDNNSFKQDTGQVDLRVLTDNGEAYIKAGAFDQDLDLPGVRTVDPTIGLNELKSDRRGTNTPNDWAEEDAQFVTLGYSGDLNENDSFVIDGGFRHKRQRSQFDYGSGFGNYTETKLDTFSLTPRLNLERFVGSLPVNWTLGADLYLYDYNSERADFKSNSNQPIHKIDVDQKSFALYGQGLVNLTEKTTLNVGWRTQRVRQEAQDKYDATASGGAFGSQAADLNVTDQENSFEIGVKHLIDDNWDVFARIGRSARFGNVDELFESNAMFQQVFSALKPQVSQDIELGVNYENYWLAANLTVFQQNIEDEIHFEPSSFQNINLDDTRHKGVELSLNFQVSPSVRLDAGYTYLHAEFTEGIFDGNDIPLIPEHTYNLSMHADLPADVKAAVSWRYVSSTLFANDLTNTFAEKIPSYQTVDLKIQKKFSQLEVALQVNNLFDEKYFNYGVNSIATAGRYNAYPLPGRSAYLTVSYEFN